MAERVNRRPPRVTAPPGWLKPGALVNYSAVIGEPATHFERLVRSEPWQLGHGAWVVAIEGVSGGVAVEALTLVAPVPSEDPHRRAVERDDFGKAIRFEIEHEDGTVVRYLGEDAARHVEVLNHACDIARAHGKADWPTALPEVFRRA